APSGVVIGDLPATNPVAGGSGTLTHDGLNGNGHSNGNGNGHVMTAMGAWSSPVTASASVGSVASATRVLAAHLGERGFYLRTGKRVLDVLGASIALVLHAPLLLLAVIAIKLESPGPVLYRSKRIGRGGRPFTFLKLRSMVDGAD